MDDIGEPSSQMTPEEQDALARHYETMTRVVALFCERCDDLDLAERIRTSAEASFMPIYNLALEGDKLALGLMRLLAQKASESALKTSLLAKTPPSMIQ